MTFVLYWGMLDFFLNCEGLSARCEVAGKRNSPMAWIFDSELKGRCDGRRVLSGYHEARLVREMKYGHGCHEWRA